MRLAMFVTAGLLVTASAVAQKTSDLDFSYVYPAQARAIPALRTWLDAQAAALRAGMAKEAAADRRDAIKQDRPSQAYTADRTWKMVTDGPRFLSRSEERDDFTGGAHGNVGFAAMVYERQTGARLTPLSFFNSPAALGSAIRPAFCRQLDDERRKARGGTLDTTLPEFSLPEFSRCIDPAKETVILGSSTTRAFDRIGFLIPPYEAGPYSDGTYEVTLPVTPAVRAAIKPGWRRYFALGPRSRGTP